METLDGRWATAEPTAVATARYLKSMMMGLVSEACVWQLYVKASMMNEVVDRWKGDSLSGHRRVYLGDIGYKRGGEWTIASGAEASVAKPPVSPVRNTNPDVLVG